MSKNRDILQEINQRDRTAIERQQWYHKRHYVSLCIITYHYVSLHQKYKWWWSACKNKPHQNPSKSSPNI